MNLFASVYLDEDVSVLVAKLLAARGFDATTAHNEGMLGKDDPEQLALAVVQRRCILSHNRLHFEDLHRMYLSTGQEHFGIVAVTRRSPYEIVNRLSTLLDTFTAEEFMNQLLYI